MSVSPLGPGRAAVPESAQGAEQPGPEAGETRQKREQEHLSPAQAPQQNVSGGHTGSAGLSRVPGPDRLRSRSPQTSRLPPFAPALHSYPVGHRLPFTSPLPPAQVAAAAGDPKGAPRGSASGPGGGCLPPASGYPAQGHPCQGTITGTTVSLEQGYCMARVKLGGQHLALVPLHGGCCCPRTLSLELRERAGGWILV